MPIRFSDHATNQLKVRKISKKRILETIRDPEKVKVSYKHRILRQKNYGGKMLQVVTVTEGSKITVISGYYLRRR